MSNSALIVFIKNFEIGKVKTRLAQSIGEDRALEIYKLLCMFTISEVKKTGLPAYFYFSNYIDEELLTNQNVTSKGSLYRSRIQSGTDLGIRMRQAFKEVHSAHDQTFILGTDCPYFTSARMLEALDQLQTKGIDIVIGPAEDGGYYGLGMKKPLDVFTGVDWSTDLVLAQSIEKFEQQKLEYKLLPALNDMDYHSDWIEFEKSPSADYFNKVIRSSSSANEMDDE